MVARSAARSNQRPDTLMQDRKADRSTKSLLQRTAAPYIGSNAEGRRDRQAAALPFTTDVFAPNCDCPAPAASEYASPIRAAFGFPPRLSGHRVDICGVRSTTRPRSGFRGLHSTLQALQPLGAVDWRFRPPLPHTGRDCRCPKRPKGRSWPRNHPEAGEYG
jgi:hypothetical protein